MADRGAPRTGDLPASNRRRCFARDTTRAARPREDDGRPEIWNPQQTRRLGAQRKAGNRSLLGPPVQPSKGRALDSGIPVSVECIPYGDGTSVVVLRRPRCRGDEDARLGLGAMALRGERLCDLCLLRHLRGDLLCQAQAGDALQVQCALPCRSPLGRVLVQKPEPRQFPAQLLRHHTAVDCGRSFHAVGVRQWLGDLAELGRSSGLPGRRWCSSRR